MSIQLSSNFNLVTNLPLDDRTVKSSIVDRDAIASVSRFDGLFVYITDTNETWQLQGGITNSDWVLVSGTSGGTVTGTGAIPQVAYWGGASVVKGEVGFEYDETTNILLSQNYKIPLCTASTVGVFYKDTARFLHTYKPAGTNDNLFFGTNSGNFTLSATSNFNANCGIGPETLQSLTSGYFNTGIGFRAGQFQTTGHSNCYLGIQTGRNGTGNSNCIAIGESALYGGSGAFSSNDNVAVGYISMYEITTGFSNVGVGNNSLQNVHNGANNTAIGHSAGSAINSGSSNILIGNSIQASSSSASNEINIGGIFKGSRASGANSGGIAIAGVTVFNVDLNANIRTIGLHNNATAQGTAVQQDIRSGTYTPTAGNNINLDSNPTPRKAQWIRVGNVVTVSGIVDAVIPILGVGTLTSFTLSKPIDSAFIDIADAAGVGATSSNTSASCKIYADIVNDLPVMEWLNSDLNSQSWSYHYTYEVIAP